MYYVYEIQDTTRVPPSVLGGNLKKTILKIVQEEYEGLLDLSQPISDLMCGEKCSFGPNTDLVSRILRQILNILEGKELTYLFISNWQTPDESIKRVI